MSSPPTIKKPPSIHLVAIPKSPLSPLEIEARDSLEPGTGYEVFFEGTILGIIPEIVAQRQQTLRWHDVEITHAAKKRKIEIPTHQKSLLLLDKMPYSAQSKPEFFADPFPHGADCIEELAMIGADNFKHTYQLYNHWFKNVSPIERLKRELDSLHMSKLSTGELTNMEKKLKITWVQSHGLLMKRLA